MVSTVYSAAVYGIDSKVISVEVDVSNGLPGFEMVGFLSTQVKEAQNRVRSALKNSGFQLSPKKITVNLSPADLKKRGTGFDLPIAVGILQSYEAIPRDRLKNCIIIGELSLDGTIQAVPGVLSMLLDAKKNHCDTCIVPLENEKEARIIPDIHVIPMHNLKELAAFLRGNGEQISSVPVSDKKETEYAEEERIDFSDICGQERAKRACMIAAAGFHNMLMVGPPGSGKSMLAKRIPGIMPDMTLEEQIEVSKIYSVMGLLPAENGLVNQRPFRSPHHTSTAIGLTGGGLIPKPGEISLAHNGILFLDEFAEFARECVETLRQPLENSEIRIFRNGYEYYFPAKVMLIAAMNPCPCGYYPNREKCRCSQGMIIRYHGKISYPLLDRMDLTLNVPEVSYKELHRNRIPAWSSTDMKQRVLQASRIQRERFRGTQIHYNTEIPADKLAYYCTMTPENDHLLELAYEEMGLSIRSLHKIIRTSRTIADLEGSTQIKEEHLSEAFSYRMIRMDIR